MTGGAAAFPASAGSRQGDEGAPIPTLSVVIPALNEAASLPLLFADLQCQRGGGWR